MSFIFLWNNQIAIFISDHHYLKDWQIIILGFSDDSVISFSVIPWFYCSFIGVTPAPVPGATTQRPPLPVCVYNGKSYHQGEKWQDGCQYNCECVDSMSGQYKCTER